LTEPIAITGALVLAGLLAKTPVKEIYNDAVSPAAKQVGRVFEDVVKIARLPLIPVQYLASFQDKYDRFLRASIDKVPDERRILPAPQLLGATLEAINYEPEDSELYNMFSELLSKASDSSSNGLVHPSYVGLIRSLSVDEARIIQRLGANGEPISGFSMSNIRDGGYNILLDTVSDLEFPENVDFYIDRLLSLELIWTEGLLDFPVILLENSKTDFHLILTSLGRRFYQAVA
jgi:hypothetical protein